MNRQTPYWLAYLTHPVHRAGLLAVAAATVLASLPWGMDAVSLGVLGIAAVETIGLAIVPSLPSFKSWADKAERRRMLDNARDSLIDEIKVHGGSSHLPNYQQMAERIQSLYRTAGDATSTLTRFDVERLEDATIDYLRLCLSDAVFKEGGARKGRDTAADIESRLRDVRQNLERSDLEPHEAKQYRQAEQQFAEALTRSSRMQSRRTLLDASLLSMPVRLEEVYQMVMTSPRAGNLSSQLEESLSKLRISEEVAMEIEEELGEVSPGLLRPRAAATSPPARASQAVRH